MKKFTRFTRKIRRAEESFSKAYFWLVSLVGIAVVLIINLKVVPALIEFVAPAEAEKIKSRIPQATAGFLGFVFLFNAFFWLQAKVWEQERRQAQENLDTNPNDPLAQEELAMLDADIKTFLGRMEFFLVLVLGLTVVWLLYNVFAPLYGLVL